MVRVWYMNDTDEDQREQHMTDPPRFVELDELKKLTGVEYFKFPVEGLDENPEFIAMKKANGYTYEDVMEVSKETLPGYEDKIKMFFKEHLHADEEIRYIAGGSGYFDVRDKNDSWLRIELNQGDMIILPAGIYHRFTLDTKNYIKARRFFIGDPVWTPINRPADEHPVRHNYLQTMGLASA